MPTPTISELMTMFSSPDHNERVSAASYAGWYWDHPDKALLVPYLVDALSGPDDSDRGGRRVFAVQSIRQIGIYNEQAVQILISWVNEGTCIPDECIQAMYALELFSDYASEATPGIIDILKTGARHERQAAIQALASIGDPVAVTPILSTALSEGEEDWIRQDALRALAIYGPDAVCAVPFLVPLLNSSDLDIRVWAASAIHKATSNGFPNGDLDWDISDWNWTLGFKQNENGEYIIVVGAKKWWQETGQHQSWSDCKDISEL
jgi:HEAT repeat protein